jgi:hypothetical protein
VGQAGVDAQPGAPVTARDPLAAPAQAGALEAA